MLVTHTLPQKIQSLTQGQMDIAFGMPLKAEARHQFKPYDKAFDSHPLHKLMSFFSKAPVFEETECELIDALPFPALYGMIGDEGFAISSLLLNHLLMEALGFTHLEQNSHHFSAFELSLIIKAIELKCGKLTLSTEVTLLEPFIHQESVKVTSFYANRSDVTLQLFFKSSLKRQKVILASKMITPERLQQLRSGDTLIFENINPKEVKLIGESTAYLLIQRNNKFFIEPKGEVR